MIFESFLSLIKTKEFIYGAIGIIILLSVIFVTLKYMNTKKDNEKDILQLRDFFNNKANIKSAIFFGIDIDKLSSNFPNENFSETIKVVKEEMYNDLKDEKFREKIRSAFGIKLADIAIFCCDDQLLIHKIKFEDVLLGTIH